MTLPVLVEGSLKISVSDNQRRERRFGCSWRLVFHDDAKVLDPGVGVDFIRASIEAAQLIQSSLAARLHPH